MNGTTEYVEKPLVEPSRIANLKLELKSVRPEDSSANVKLLATNSHLIHCCGNSGNGLNQRQQSSLGLTSRTI